jgi:hypothetical protein
MRGAFAKALIVGNLAFFVLAAVVGCLMMTAIMIAAALPPDTAESIHQFSHLLETSQVTASFVLGTSVIAGAIAAGYIAARSVASHQVLVGALATSIWTAGSIVELATGGYGRDALLPGSLNFIFSFGCPLISAMGGYFAKQSFDATAVNNVPVRLRDILATTFRWLLALFIAVVGYLMSMAFAAKLTAASNLGGSALVFGTVFAALIGAHLAKPRHRRLVTISALAVIILTSTEELVRAIVAGNLAHTQAFTLATNAFGAALSYLYLSGAFPDQFPPPSGKWWWLSSSRQTFRWSRQERRARSALFIITLAIWLTAFTVGYLALQGIGVEIHFAVLIAGLAMLVPAAVLARPIYALIQPTLLREADLNAALRVQRPFA